MPDPLFLEPSFHPRIWGGRRLSSVLGYDIPEGPVGECWGVSAHANGPSHVRNGPHRGRSLIDVWRSDPLFFGRDPDTDVGDFPLLVKFLDARDWLSVQVHPNDAEAAELEGVPLGKTECWFVVAAEPGAELIIGHTAAAPEELRRRVDAADWDSLLLRRRVSAGDFVYVPSGTIHAVGPGLLICEVQQNCDTTYRVYDFDRADAAGNLRDLHLDKAKQVSLAPYDASTTDTAGPVERVPGGTRQQLVAGPFFTVTRLQATGDGLRWPSIGYSLLTVVSGSGKVAASDWSYHLSAGDHVVLPAGLGEVVLSGDVDVIASMPAP